MGINNIAGPLIRFQRHFNFRPPIALGNITVPQTNKTHTHTHTFILNNNQSPEPDQCEGMCLLCIVERVDLSIPEGPFQSKVDDDNSRYISSKFQGEYHLQRVFIVSELFLCRN